VPLNTDRGIWVRIPAVKNCVFLTQFKAPLWHTEPSIEWLAQVVSSAVKRQTGETAPHVRQTFLAISRLSVEYRETFTIFVRSNCPAQHAVVEHPNLYPSITMTGHNNWQRTTVFVQQHM